MKDVTAENDVQLSFSGYRWLVLQWWLVADVKYLALAVSKKWSSLTELCLAHCHSWLS